MSHPMHQRRLRNRSLCCLYPTPPPYPRYYHETTAANKSAILANCQLTLSKSMIADNVRMNNQAPGQTGDMAMDDIWDKLGQDTERDCSNISRINGHRSAPRHAHSTERENERADHTKSLVTAHLGRARRDQFELSVGNHQLRSSGDNCGGGKDQDDQDDQKLLHTVHKSSSSGNSQGYDSTSSNGQRRESDSTISSGSFSSGESDAAEDGRSALFDGGVCNQAMRTGPRNTTVSCSPSSSSSPFSPSRLDYFSQLRYTFTDEILRVLEQDGLIQQNSPSSEQEGSNCSAERRSSSEYNVIELSKQYRKKELSQKRAVEKVQSISDVDQLRIMLDGTEDEGQRQAIRDRLIELTKGRSGAKENDSPIKENSPSTTLGGIMSLTRATLAVPNENGSPIDVNGQETKTTASEIKSSLLRWCQAKTKGYPHVNITNYSKSWCDGMAFCALIHHFYPDSFDYSKLNPKDRRENFELAFRVAEQLGDVAPLLEVDDMMTMGDNLDYKCVFTYVQQFYRRFHNVP